MIPFLLVSTTPAAEISSVVQGNTAFALDLYAQLSATPGNLFFSPYSISTCLAMTYAGARGNTEQEMSRVLYFSLDQQQLHSAFGELQRVLGAAEKQPGIELSIANALWAQRGHPFLPAFVDIAKDPYQANINQADFETGAEAARQEINHWAAQKTKDKIRDILPPGSLDQLTRLVLVNAIYFKGSWAVTFRESETSNQPFHATSSTRVNAPLMHHFDTVRYGENAESQVVELPYTGRQLSMVILLPRGIDGCNQLERGLTPAFLDRLLAGTRERKVELFIPKFKFNSGFGLNRALLKMGINDAFAAGKADFTGIDGTTNLFISAAFHKGFVEVNEEGTEAAAATAVAVRTASLDSKPKPPPVFRADHPFIFLIRDMKSGSILFLGRVADPTKSA